MKKTFLSLITLSILFLTPCKAKEENMHSTLTVEEKSVAAVSAAAARGNYTALKTALAQGLDAGIPVNTFKEI